jgi:hypothetical protein
MGRIASRTFWLSAGATLVALAGVSCGGSTANSAADAGNSPGGGDASAPVDASGETGTPSDAGAPVADASRPGRDAGPHGTCTPSTATFTPRTAPVPVPNQEVCAPSAIAAFVTACGDNGTLTSCNAWLATNTATDAGAGNACGNCIAAPNNSGGLYFDPNGVFNPNYGGCVELLDKTGGAACAAAFNNQSDCEGVACDSCMQGYYGCLNAADQGSCATYVSADNTACAMDNADGGALNTCAPDPNGQDGDYTFILTLICGGGASDAGTD